MVDWKAFVILGLGIVQCGGSVEAPPPCVSDAASEAADVLESGAVDAPESGPLACWECELPAAQPGAHNACTHTFLDVCASCEVFGPECTPRACAACAADAAGE